MNTENTDIEDLEVDPEEASRDETLAKAFTGHSLPSMRPMNAATADALTRTGSGLLSGNAGLFDIAAFCLLHSQDEDAYRATLNASFSISDFRDLVTRNLEVTHPAEVGSRGDEIRDLMTDYVKILTESPKSKKKQEGRNGLLTG